MCRRPGRRHAAELVAIGVERRHGAVDDVALRRRVAADADVLLPADYLTALPEDDAPYSAALYPFEHTLEGSPAQQTAMQQYECYLHYYVLGLQAAGSPYAYHSIGSSFAVHMDRYAAVHGFPKKLAGHNQY